MILIGRGVKNDEIHIPEKVSECWCLKTCFRELFGSGGLWLAGYWAASLYLAGWLPAGWPQDQARAEETWPGYGNRVVWGPTIQLATSLQADFKTPRTAYQDFQDSQDSKIATETPRSLVAPRGCRRIYII